MLIIKFGIMYFMIIRVGQLEQIMLLELLVELDMFIMNFLTQALREILILHVWIYFILVNLIGQHLIVSAFYNSQVGIARESISALSSTIRINFSITGIPIVLK